VAYRADIEIAVRGAQELKRLQNEISATSKLIDGLNNYIENIGSGGVVRNISNLQDVVQKAANAFNQAALNTDEASIENYSRAVSKAERALRKAAQGTRQEEDAVRSLVTAMDAENKARARRNFLIAQEVANRRRIVATANAGYGAQGPQAASVRATRGAASPIRGTVNMPGSPAALATATGSSRGTRAASGGIGSRVGGAISGSIIGGAFPLLFGQGGGAAAGGAIGGLVGGLAGPGGSFAGSLLGTLLGDIASRGQAVKQLGEDLGFSAAQAKTLADAFKTANTDVEKFTAVIQNIRGVGLELEEQATAVQLVTALTEKYGGSFEKVGNAVTSALESGKVSQAVLNQLTSQGITVQDALAAKYDVSRDKILEMAKKGEISVQSLLDTLIELGNASTTAAEKTQTPFEKALATTGQLFQGFWKEVQAIFAGISSNGADAATGLINLFNTLLKEVLFPLGKTFSTYCSAVYRCCGYRRSCRYRSHYWV
jgi:tape measure domain-containing protein